MAKIGQHMRMGAAMQIDLGTHRRVGIVQTRRERVEIRRGDLTAVAAKVGVAHVIGDDEQDVGTGRFGGGLSFDGLDDWVTVADAASIKLPRRIPYHVAMELLLTGRRIDVHEAKHWGLVNEIVPADRLLARAREMLKHGLAASQVAFDLGFADQSHFQRVFKAHAGTTPGRYRLMR